MPEKFSQLEALRAVLALDRETFDAYSKMLLCALISRADDKGRSWSSVARLQAETGISERKIQMLVAEFRKAKILDVRYGGSTPGNKMANVYTISVKALSTGAPHAPVHPMHPCTPCGVPVHPMHPTGAPGAPQESMEESIEESKREIAPEALVLVSPEPSKTKVKKTKSDPHHADAIAVLEHWAANPRLRSQRLKFSLASPAQQKHVATIAARLADYSADDLRAAVDGCAKSDFHVDRGFVGPDLIFRADKVERFMKIGRGEIDPNKSTGRKGTPVQPASGDDEPWMREAT